MRKKRFVFYSIFFIMVGGLIVVAHLYPFHDNNCGLIETGLGYEMNGSCEWYDPSK